MMKTNRKIVVLLGVESAFSLLVLFILMAIVHEGAHYIAVLILGIPIARFALFDPNYFAPVFVSASQDYTTGMTKRNRFRRLVPAERISKLSSMVFALTSEQIYRDYR